MCFFSELGLCMIILKIYWGVLTRETPSTDGFENTISFDFTYNLIFYSCPDLKSSPEGVESVFSWTRSWTEKWTRLELGSSIRKFGSPPASHIMQYVNNIRP